MSVKLIANPAEIHRALSLLCADGEVYELRSLNTTKATVSGYYNDFGALARDATACSDRREAPGVYFTANPVRPELLARAHNRLEGYAKHTAGDADITRRCWLPLDFDPVRPAGISATDVEHRAALTHALEVREFLQAREWPQPILIDSGNGSYLLYRIDLPNDDRARDLLKRILEALAAWFDGSRVSIDKTMFNAGRIIRIPGTVNRKGDSLPERPHRLARIIEGPEKPEVVTREQLEELAARAPEPERPRSNGARPGTTSFNLDSFVAQHGIPVKRIDPYKDGRRLILDACVFDASHSGTSAAIIEGANGSLGYSCLHNGCADRHWADVRERFEPGYRERFPGAAGQSENQRLIAELAALDPIVQAQRRKIVAKQMGVPVKAIDEAIKQYRAQQNQSRSEPLTPPPPEPWPDPVAGEALLNEIVATLNRFLALPPGAADAIALWIMFAHCFEVAEVSPRLFFKSPTKRCGKSTAMEVVAQLVPCPLATSNITPSALFRAIDASNRVTLFIDEADAAFKNGGNEDLRALLNAGHTPDKAFVLRSVPVGEKEWAARKFSVWCPIAIAAIGNLPDTIEDRSIINRMRRRHRSEKIEPARRRTLKSLAPIAQEAARWAKDNIEALRDARPAVPAPLDDRAADGWELLIAIADRAGGEWPARARNAALALSAPSEPDNETLSVELLRDIEGIFESRAVERIGSSDLVEALVSLDSRPWGEFRHGRPLTGASLARMLKTFEVYKRERAGGSAYQLSEFRDAFDRYLGPCPLPQGATVPQTLGGVGRNDDPERPPAGTLRGEQTPTESQTSGTMALQNGGMGDREEF